MRIIVFCLIAFVMMACADSQPVETFAASTCKRADTGQTRTRKVRGACIARSASSNGHVGTCTAYARKTVYEKHQRVSCTKDQWVRR